VSQVEVADLLREVVATGELKASPEQWQVVNALLNCRTAALGGHLYKCQECSKEQPRYNSCRNRHCPKCQGQATAEWLDARAEELLDVDYFHLVFTIPHGLNGIVLQNKRVVLNILFQAVSRTLADVAKKRLGGKLGFMSVLHTWGQKVEAHFHLHCVIPGVVLKPDGSAEKIDSNYLLPQRVLSIVFRAVFCKMLEKAYSELSFEGQQCHLRERVNFEALLQEIRQKDWVVYAKKPFAEARAVFCYLSRYTHRVAISNSRILSSAGGRTTFTHKDYADNSRRKTMTLETTEFIRRFLLHVLPKQFIRIRYCGFLAPGVRTKALARLKAQFGPKPQNSLSPASKPELRCSQCGKQALVYIAQIPRRVVAFAQPQLKNRSPKTKQLPLVA
jgi:hypothetical protein